MNIYSCVDHDNIDKVLTVFYSCWKNTTPVRRKNLHFYILTDDNPNHQYIDTNTPFRVEIKALDTKYLMEHGWISLIDNFNSKMYKLNDSCKHLMNFARFFVFDFFNIDKALYLDWDMIVTTDIWELEQEYQKCGQSLNSGLIVARSRYNFITNQYINLLGFHDIVEADTYIKVENKKQLSQQEQIIAEELQVVFNFDLSNEGFNSGMYIV
jgi:lipopolysaccharide biosynthesis glycosyltransferase